MMDPTIKSHDWSVGELCSCTYDGRGHGIVYRVVRVERINGLTTLNIKPVLGLIQNIDHRKTRYRIRSTFCKPISLIKLGSEYMKMGLFLVEEAKRYSEDDTTPHTPTS